MNVKYLPSLILTLIILMLNHQPIISQSIPFGISLKPMEIEGLGGIQSYAFGQADGNWLIVGGRLDGLHRRQPWASFDIAGHNNQLIVVDPVEKRSWSAPLSQLPNNIREPLSSTNMEFYQEGDQLYCLGGYGYSDTAGDHVTYNTLTAINVPAVIGAIVDGKNFGGYFRQISDDQFQVTGGRLRKIDDRFYLLGGQKFMGRYNPMGPDHGLGFIQEYTNAVRIFDIMDDGSTIEIIHYPGFIDQEQLHRRDYNAEAQILPDGSEGITLFSGVFQPTVDLPFLNAVTVGPDGYEVEDDFVQHYNHYHCPAIPLYAAGNNEMYTVFFGGMAQFYKENGMMVQDNNVPFVPTIAAVIRDAHGTMREEILTVEMPGLMGAGAEFIPNPAVTRLSNDVFDLDAMTMDSILLGHIFGGINSSAPNIFFTNDGTQSFADNRVLKVYLVKDAMTQTEKVQANNRLDLVVYPNPTYGTLYIECSLTEQEDVKLTLHDASGKTWFQKTYRELPAGKSRLTLELPGLFEQQVFLITARTSGGIITHQIILD